MASKMESALSATYPDWYAAPITIKFACILLSKKCSDNSVAFKRIFSLENSLIRSIK